MCVSCYPKKQKREIYNNNNQTMQPCSIPAGSFDISTISLSSNLMQLQQEPEVAKIDVTKPFSLQAIAKEDQSLDLCRLAVDLDPSQLRYAHFQDYDMCKKSVRHNGFNIRYAHDQTHDLCLMAVRQNVLCIDSIRNQTLEMLMEAVKRHPSCLRDCKIQNLEMCELAFNANVYNIKYAQFQTVEMSNKLILEHEGYAWFKYLHHQTPEVCWAAVKAEWQNLEFVKDKTIPLCRLALQQPHNHALQFVPNKTLKMCLWGIKHCAANYEFAPKKTLWFQKQAIKTNPKVFEYIRPQTPELYAYMLKMHPDTTIRVNPDTDSDSDDGSDY